MEGEEGAGEMTLSLLANLAGQEQGCRPATSGHVARSYHCLGGLIAVIIIISASLLSSSPPPSSLAYQSSVDLPPPLNEGSLA